MSQIQQNKQVFTLSSERILSQEDLLNFCYSKTHYNSQQCNIDIQKGSLSQLRASQSKLFPTLSYSEDSHQSSPHQEINQSDYVEQFSDLNERVAFYRLYLLTRIQILLKARENTRSCIVSFLQSLLNRNIMVQDPYFKSQQLFINQIEKLCYGSGECQIMTPSVSSQQEKISSVDLLPSFTIVKKNIKQVIPESIKFPGLTKFQKSIICNVEGVKLTKLVKKVILANDLLNRLDAFIILSWQSQGGWIELLKPAYQQGGSKSNLIEFIAMRLRAMTSGSRQLAKRNNNLEFNSLMVKYSKEIAPLHQIVKKLIKEVVQAMNWDPSIILSQAKAIQYLDLNTIGPQIAEMQTTVLAFQKALKLVDFKVKQILKIVRKEKQCQEQKDSSIQFKSAYNSLNFNLRQLLNVIVKESQIFQPSQQSSAKDQALQTAQSKKKPVKFKSPCFGYGTQQLINYIKKELQSGAIVHNPYKKQFSSLLSEILSAQSQQHRRPKIPKGTRDMDPFQMKIKKIALNKIRSVFQRHGAIQIDTPVFQLKQTLTGKYGQDSKLIYNLQDQGGELLSLRYDLTVPFARYVALKNISSIKRFHIAKVYRRDNPQIQKGRFRQFYQCDFDIAGTYSGVMLPDVDVLRVIVDILRSLELGIDFVIKLNHRRFLDAIISLSGCDDSKSQKFNAICSSIDKLDKEPWETVRKELIFTKKIDIDSVDRLGKYVTELRGGVKQILSKLQQEKILDKSEKGLKALSQMKRLADFMEQLQIIDKFQLDFSLARGLDYYTGMIFEAVLVQQEGSIGSIAGGGRYDELIGQFTGGGKKKTSIPSVGGSIGIQRIFSILEGKAKQDKMMRASQTQVLVCSIGKDMIKSRLNICNRLWNSGLNAEYLYVDNPKPANQLTYALQNLIPLMIWIGQDELKNQEVKLKVRNANVLLIEIQQMTATKQQISVPLNELEQKVLEVYEAVKDKVIQQIDQKEE